MSDPIAVFWTPAGVNIPDIGSKALVDVTDGDTPKIEMPIRMLSVDTPEVTARTAEGAAMVDQQFSQLAEWLRAGSAPASPDFAAYILPKLSTGQAGTLQFTNGKAASNWFKAEIDRRLTRPDGSRRKLFVRVSQAPFDNYGRLLAYIAPNYSPQERATMTHAERATFNLGLVEAGQAAPFVLYPNIPGELDYPLLTAKAVEAFEAKRGQWADPLSLTGYEYRMCEKLFDITRRLKAGEKLTTAQRFEWRSRYAADVRTRELHEPEGYMAIPEPYRLWFWPQDVQDGFAKLNLVPGRSLVRVRS
ncbi:hypothetical protein [Prosthecomicrobium sp. N25]|uniref:hypothetical protein n=1 Tax=Prosthecomicrobium sp. N25 TaxID=3129254 RepID=UPI003077F450